MVGFVLQGSTSGNPVEADVSNSLRVSTRQATQRLGGETAAPNQVGAIRMFCEKDAGASSGVAYLQSPYCSDDGRLAVAVDTPTFFDAFTETTQNTGIWRHQFTTMTMTMGSGFLLCNANSTAATSTGCQYTTWATFPLYGNNATHLEMTGAITSIPQAGQVFEAGFFGYGANAYTAPTEGCYFRLDSAGLIGVINYAGVETTTAVLITAANFPVNQNGQFKIIISQREAEFWLNGTFLGDIDVPAGNGEPFMNGALPVSFQQRNSGAVTGTQMQVKVAGLHIDQQNYFNKPMADICTSFGYMGSQGQDGGTMGSTAILSNAATAAAAAVVNTTASAQFTGLGGVFLVLPTLTAGTDGILCDYAIPAGGVNQTPRRLVIRGVNISSGVQTVLTGGPLNMAYSLAYGHTAVSLAQTETASFATATTKAPRRIPLGVQNYIAAAAAGIESKDLVVKFTAPIYVNPGERVAIAVRNLGTVTTLGALAISVMFDANWE